MAELARNKEGYMWTKYTVYVCYMDCGVNMLSMLLELLVSYCHAHYNGCTVTLIALSSGAVWGMAP